MKKNFHLTLIHPCIGRRKGEKYIRLWQMEPLPPAVIAALTPSDVEISFYDDRMEEIPYDNPTNLVALSVETYTAKRCYQIASHFRRRGIPVVMGGFHASLCPEEVSEYADSIVIGEAENIWPQVINDYRNNRPQKVYQEYNRPALFKSNPDRRIFKNKNYLPVRLIELGRGCPLKCEFCAIQTVYKRSQSFRPIENIVEEIQSTKEGAKLTFFIDDNITGNFKLAKELFKALIPLKIKWVSQCTINAATDEELLTLMEQSGCQGVLIGFESLKIENLKLMGKLVNTIDNYDHLLRNFHRHGIRIYGTFVFGYDHDTPEIFNESLEFATRHGFYLTGFNHMTPFPGTPLYQRLESEGRLIYPKWWLDDSYGYNQLPFRPSQMNEKEVERLCLQTRIQFYSWKRILRRAFHPVNRRDFSMWFAFFVMNLMHQRELGQRDHFPLGDETDPVELLKVK